MTPQPSVILRSLQHHAPYILLTTGAIVGALLLLTGNAQAQDAQWDPSQRTCSNVYIPIDDDSATVYTVFDTNLPAQDVCATGDPDVNGNYLQVLAGDPFTLDCAEVFFDPGVGPPVAADITVHLLVDDEGFPGDQTNSIASAIWTRAECQDATTRTLHCTTDGTAGGAARYGPLRLLVIRDEGDAIAEQDSETDDSAVLAEEDRTGIVQCGTRPTTIANTLSDNTNVNPYVGGDTLRIRTNHQAEPYTGATGTQDDYHLDVLCDGLTHINNDQAPLDTTQDDHDNPLTGSTTTLPDDCLLSATFDVDLDDMDLLEYDGLTWKVWIDDGNLPAGVTLTTDTLLTYDMDQKTVDRTLTITAAGCTLNVGTELDVQVVNRGETVDTEAAWTHARADAVTGRPAVAYLPRDAEALTDEAGAAAFTTTVAAGGRIDYAGDIKTDAPATTPSPLDYGCAAETYVGSVAAANLANFGRTPDIFDVSDFLTLDTHACSTMFGNGNPPSASNNVTSYIIAVDEKACRAIGLQGARAQTYAGVAVTCDRFNPRNVLIDTFSYGTTGPQGNAPADGADPQHVQMDVTPPQGEWLITCTATTDGNTLDYDTTWQYISPFSGNLTIAITQTPYTDDAGDRFLNITATPLEWDAGFTVMPPDDTGAVILNLTVWNETTTGTVDRWFLLPDTPMSFVNHDQGVGIFYHNLTLPPEAWDHGHAAVKMDLSFKVITNSEELDPGRLNFDDLDVQGNVTLETAFDQVAGSLATMAIFAALLLFLVRGALFPAATSALALANTLFDPPLFTVVPFTALVIGFGILAHMLSETSLIGRRRRTTITRED